MIPHHYLLGFGKDDEELKVEFPIQEDRLDAVKSILTLYPDDPEALDPYVLSPRQAEMVAKITGRSIEGGAYNFFMQTYDDADAIDRITLSGS